MTSSRHPKRARKKERRAARREEWAAYARRRRRQRMILLLGTAGVVIVGAAIAFFALKPEKKVAATPAPTPRPTAFKSEAIKPPVKTPVACGSEVPKTAGSIKHTYEKPADQHLDPSKSYIWRLETSCGTIDVALDAKRAPKTTNSIAFLTRQHFFDGLFFHRNVPNFVIQGGDPAGEGTGGSGYKVVEPPPKDLKYEPGIVAMAKGGQEPAGTSSSQFFIMVGTQTQLPPEYALVGKVETGLDVAKQIVTESAGEGAAPPKAWVYIDSATIVEG